MELCDGNVCWLQLLIIVDLVINVFFHLVQTYQFLCHRYRLLDDLASLHVTMEESHREVCSVLRSSSEGDESRG